MNRNSNFITDIEKNKFTPVKEVKQFDNVRLSYELFANGDELDVTGSNISIRVLKADNTVVIQNTGFTINKNKITLDLNNEVTKVAGIANIEIKIIKNNKQITTFATKLDIEKSVLNEVYAKKNLVEILVELDTKLNIADDRTSKLDTKNALAQTNINNLDTRNNTATTKIRDLDSRNATATTNINNLDTKNNEAVTNKNSLYTENSVAQMHLDELKKKTEVATNTKEELNQFINNNKDMSKIHERINNNAKEITNLKDSIAQNRPIVIAEDTPIGSIVWYASKEVLGVIDEDCWRVCNGQTLNKADFTELYELIKDNPNYTKTETTFNLPDLISSKRFIRAVGDSYNVGYVENDELKSHRHFLVNSKGKFFEISGSSAIGAVNNAVDTFFVSGATKPNKVGYTNEGEAWMYATCTNYVGGDETRPKNIQFIPLIKCKCRAKDIVDLATDVEQAKAGFNTLKEAMDSKATKESIAEITEEISNAEEAILDINNELEEARNGEVSLDARIEKDINKINDNIDNLHFLPFENENIYIDNSLNGYTRDLVIKGKTLHNIRIGEDIQNPGYTVWTKVSDNEYNAVGTTEQKGNGGLILSARTLFKPNTKYSLIFEYTASGVAGGEIRPDIHTSYNAATTTVHNIQNGSRVIKLDFTTRADITDKRCKIALSEFIGTMNMKNIMIIENIDYTPKYFEGIKSVGELEENKISILSHGKNILNPKSEFLHFQKGATGLGVGLKVGLGIETRRCVFRIPAKDNTYYSISSSNSNIALVTSYKDGTYKSDTGWNNRSYFTGTDTGELFISIKKADNSPFNTKEELYELCKTSKLQVEESQSISSFESYKDDKKDILLPFENGLKSLPNGVSDEIKKGANEYKINKRVGRKILDGTESWIIWQNNNSSDKQVMGFAFPLLNSPNNRNFYVMSTKFISGGANSDPDTGDHTYYTKSKELIGGYYGNASSTKRLGLSILKSKLASPDVAGLKKYLRDLYNSGNPVVIYYELAEPVVYELDKDLNLEVYKDKTYISSNNAIQPVISCKAPVDVQATISTLRENNKELEEENIKLKELSYKNEATNDIQQIDIDNNQMATVELFEMLIGGVNIFKIKGGDNGMVEVYVSLILKGKKTLDEVPSIIRPKVEAMLKDLEVEL